MIVAAAVLLDGRVPATALLALAVAAGLPHGALDHAVARRAFGLRYGKAWWRPFLAGYLALASATLLLWWTVPGVALFLFLGLSLFHFGAEDAATGAPARLMRIMAHGGAVIVVPAACHPVAVTQLFAMLAPGQASTVEALLAGPLLVVWIAATAGTLAVHAAGGTRADRAAAIDLMLVMLLFGSATPLVAFSLYFAAIHTPRALAGALPAYRRETGTILLPVVLTMLGATLGGVLFAGGAATTVDDNIVRSTFLLLSALTVPHMWLEWQARRAAAQVGNRMTGLAVLPAMPGVAVARPHA